MAAVDSVIPSDRARLAEIPVGAIRGLIGELVQGAWGEAEGLRLLTTLGRDVRPAVRREVAEAVGRLVGSAPITEAIEILRSLSDDQDDDVRDAVARALAAWLARAEELWQIIIVEEWAASPMRLTRETLVKALSIAVETPVSDLVLELLAQDPVTSIRLEVVKALGARLDVDPSGCAELLTQLAMDPKGPVRWQARRWLRRLEVGPAPCLQPSTRRCGPRSVTEAGPIPRLQSSA